MPSRPLRGKRTMLDLAEVLARQAGAGVGTGVPPSLLTRDPDAPAGNGKRPAQFGPNVQQAGNLEPVDGRQFITPRPTESLTLTPYAGQWPTGRPEGGFDPANYQTRPTESKAMAPLGVNPATYYQTRPTESSTIAQPPAWAGDATWTPAPGGGYTYNPPDTATAQSKALGALDVIFGQGGPLPEASQTSTPAPTASSSRPSGLYTTVGDIFAEPAPQSQDPQEWWAFHQDRFRKIANHYNLDPREVAKQEALIAGQIALSPDMTAPQVAQLWEAAEKNLVATNDFTPERSMQPSPAAQDTMLTGTDGGNPLARYGVYTPEQTAAIQAAIGQYVTQQDQSFQAATGFKPDPKTQQAYMMQAQAFPAINALENQQRLAQQVYELEDQVRYYQALQQTGQLVPQQQTQAAADGTDTAAAIASIMDQLG